MSLSDLEKRAVAKPLEAELDRQKEKAAKFKKRLHALQAAVDRHIGVADAYNESVGIKERPIGLRTLAEALEESKK